MTNERRIMEPQTVEVPAGPFLMGSAGDALSYNDEQPQHEVTLPAFEIGRYPVTNAEYAAFVEATDRDPPDQWSDGRLPEKLAAHPVVNVTWRDAQAYADWLQEQTGTHYRLPTEAEWEKAARSTDGRLWPWGNEWDPGRCNSREGGPGTTTPVGQYSPIGDSPFGCADMAGNVWEWCQSLYKKPYPYQADDGREDLETSDIRVLRGGSFSSSERSVRCAFRDWYNPYGWLNSVGFRVVVAPALDSDSLDSGGEGT